MDSIMNASSNSQRKSIIAQVPLVEKERPIACPQVQHTQNPKIVLRKLYDPNKVSFLDHCRSILPKKRPRDSGKMAYCNLCHENKVVYGRDGAIRSYAIVRHALVHSTYKIYACHHCEFKSNFEKRIKSHLKTMHPDIDMGTNVATHFDDNTIEYADEIKQLIRMCFEKREPHSDGAVANGASKVLSPRKETMATNKSLKNKRVRSTNDDDSSDSDDDFEEDEKEAAASCSSKKSMNKTRTGLKTKGIEQDKQRKRGHPPSGGKGTHSQSEET